MASVRSRAVYKITVNYAAIFIWATILLGGAIYLAVNSEATRQSNRQIRSELNQLIREPNQAKLERDLANRQTDELGSSFLYALFDKDGDRLAGALDMPRPARGLRVISLPMAHGENHLVRIGAVDMADGSRLVVAQDMTLVESLNKVLLKVLAVAFIASLAVSAIGGLILGRYLRSRLQPISTTANAIVSGDLAPRVPVRVPGDEFDAAGHALNLMLDRIAGLMENLRQVSSDIAHDLRKPLIRLLCQTDRLDQVEGALESVYQTGDELLALFASILRLAEVEGGDLQRSFEQIDLSTVMNELAESFAPALADAGDTINWVVEPHIYMLGNRELLGQLAANLLDNARIHTPVGTMIRLGLARDGAQAKLVVEDNGPGVSEADCAKLLQRFYRTEASRTTAGNGLGLSLVAAVARAHGGTVTIENADPGLRILISLPCLRDDRLEESVGSDNAGRVGTLRTWISARRRF
jgi:signal transduction histidine kinase